MFFLSYFSGIQISRTRYFQQKNWTVFLSFTRLSLLLKHAPSVGVSMKELFQLTNRDKKPYTSELQTYRSVEINLWPVFNKTSTNSYKLDNLIDKGALWSLFATFSTKVLILFGFWKRLILLSFSIAQTDHKYLVNNLIINWPESDLFSEITEILIISFC